MFQVFYKETGPTKSTMCFWILQLFIVDVLYDGQRTRLDHFQFGWYTNTWSTTLTAPRQNTEGEVRTAAWVSRQQPEPVAGLAEESVGS